MNFSESVSAFLARGQAEQAVAFARDSADRADPEAFYCLATWHVIGAILPRDLSVARRFLDLAAARGHVEATRMLIAFMANGTGAPPNWCAALAHLRRLADVDDDSRRQLRLIEHMDIDRDGLAGAMPNGVDLDQTGVVRRFPALLTHAECDHVVRAAGGYMEPALVFDPLTGRQVRNPVRSADAMVTSPTREDLVLQAIALRLAAASGTAVDQGEATTVMRYRPGQEFKLHHDSLDRTGNQRVMTMLVYLNDGFVGGETVFPHLGVTVRPRKGDAILFDNVRDGRRLPLAQHAGLPVRHGEKWLLSKWIRAQPFDVWQGPERGSVRAG